MHTFIAIMFLVTTGLSIPVVITMGIIQSIKEKRNPIECINERFLELLKMFD